MVLMRFLIVSWFVLQCLVVPIGAQIIPAPTSDSTPSDAAEQEERSEYNKSLAEGIRVRNDKLARKTMPLAITCTQRLCSRFSLSPPLVGHIVTAFPRTHALRVHQLISVYRI